MSGNAGRSRGRRPGASSWEPVASWYDGWVGDRGSIYHQRTAIPAVLDLLDPKPGEEILDIGAGQGVLAPYVVGRGSRYTGIDASPRLVDIARRRHGATGRFLVGDARALDRIAGLRRHAHDAAVFLLSIQDMDPLDSVLRSADWALGPSGRVVLLMTHPAFRQPRHSGWGFDEGRRLVYRRVDAYLTEMAVPMKSIGEAHTVSFHRPISTYVNGLAAFGFATDNMREIPDLPSGQRPAGSARARRRPADRADMEIPLFLALRARRD